MTTIIYETGDLVRSTETYITHGCNAQGVMGSGIAKQVRADYPEAYLGYRREYEIENELSVGEIIPVACRHPTFGAKTIINAITQEFYGGQPGVVYVSYDGVRECVKLMDQFAQMSQIDGDIAASFNGSISRIGFPLIGAGLAGGNWAIIAGIIEEESKHFQPVVYLFDGKMPA